SITYSYFGGTTIQRTKVDSLIKEWLPYANISFEPVEEHGMIRIAFEAFSGSWSYVGTTNQQIDKTKPTMNLGWIGTTELISDDDRSVVLHEFGHVLGLLHEHQSPARGGKIHLNEDRVYEYYKATQNWDRTTIKSQIIDVYQDTDVSNYSELDLNSIMMYFMPAEMNDEGIAVPPNKKLSDIDKAYMVINYPRPKPHDGARQWTLEYALKVAGVDAVTTQKILSHNSDTSVDAHAIRGTFIRYQLSRRVHQHQAPHAVTATGERLPSPAGLWCQTSESLMKSANPSELPEGAHRSFIIQDDIFWDLSTEITYGFLGDATDYQMQRVRTALALYQKHTCLRFVEVPKAETDGWDFNKYKFRSKCQVRIQFGEGNTGHGFSLIGAAATRSVIDFTTFKLADCYDLAAIHPFTSIYLSDIWKHRLAQADAVLYHELGHMLGLDHEEESPNATHIEIDSVRPSKYFVATKHDRESCMLTDGFRYTKEHDASQRKSTPLNSKPSPTDLALLQLIYPDSGEEGGKFAKALDAFDFVLDMRKNLLKAAVDAVVPGASQKLRDLRLKIARDLTENKRLAKKQAITSPFMAVTGDTPIPTATHVPGFLRQLVASLKEFFNPGGDQMFILQFPGRFLDQGSFAWDTQSAGVYGQFIKPTAVNESEFRLVDQLYDLTDTVAGPNGTNLSMIYEDILNNLVPKFVGADLRKQQSAIRTWLMKDVEPSEWVSDVVKRQKQREDALSNAVAVRTGTKVIGVSTAQIMRALLKQLPAVSAADPVPAASAAHGLMFDISSPKLAKTSKLTRLELSEVLMNEYLHTKQTWELERDNLIRQATRADLGREDSQMALNDLTRELAHITSARQAQIAGKYTDAVVRGYSHSVREYMGYMDISGPAEALQDAKDALRHSAMSSLDGSMKVYPVQMNPLDWFEGLSTSFKLEDLTENPEIIRIQINSKSQQLDTLNSQLVSLSMGSKGDPAALRAEVARAQQELDNAQSALSHQYSSNVISMAKTCLNAKKDVDTKILAGKLGVAEAVLGNIASEMAQVRAKQDALTQASRALSQILAAHALAEATDTKQQQQQIVLQIQSLTSELNELHSRWNRLTAKSGGANLQARVDTQNEVLDPKAAVELPEEGTAGGSRWQSITLRSTSSSRKDLNYVSSSAGVDQWSCNMWLASGSGGSTSSSAATGTSAQSTDDIIDLAFRATLVTVDRGGWFRPHFFKKSQSFYKVDKNVSWSDGQKNPSGALTGFPIGILIAKDIVIKVVHTGTTSENTRKTDTEAAASSGGFLCFSYSQSSSSNSTSQSKGFQTFSNGYVIKIPGPQILGYMIQKTAADATEVMPATLPEGFLIPDSEYDAAQKPAHAPAIPSGSPAVSEDKMKEVIGKLVSEKIGEIFKEMRSAPGGST
ncbi:hypothetical protein FB451DRAFT_1050784, partial [Mycena latifolia]